MGPTVALKFMHAVQIDDILLETVEGRQLRLRLIARPNSDQAEIIAGLDLKLQERICADRDVTPGEFAGETPSSNNGVFESTL